MSTRIVKINRGDSYEFFINVTDKYNESQKHLLTTNEVVYFALLYPHQRFEDALLIKGYTLNDQNSKTGEILVSITPEDTKNLMPGVYYYTVKLKCGGTTIKTLDNFYEADEIRTLIERTKFIINE